MDKNTKPIKNLPDEDAVISLLSDSLGTASTEDFSTSFFSQFCARTCIDVLQRCVITPSAVNEIARLFLMFNPKSVSYVLPVGRNMKIKDIVNLTSGFNAKLSEFPDEIECICKRYKCKKCIVIFNYTYKKGIIKELYDLSLLHSSLSSLGITLVDAVKHTNSGTENIISTYNKNGYIK